MGSSPLSQLARFIGLVADFIAAWIGYVYGAIIVLVIVLLLARYLLDLFQISPFGRFVYRLRRPATEMLHNVRSSRFYFPLKRALGFDPAVLMILIATAIVCYVISIVVGNLLQLLGGIVRVLLRFDQGQVAGAARNLIGVLLLAVIFYLLTLMLIVFVNWLFGLLSRAAFWSLRRIEPLLRLFEFGGMFAGWSFLILWIALSFAATAVTLVFLS
ncbi:MAG: hypothetical protein U0Z53_27185 [Blastocatellia bacterium]